MTDTGETLALHGKRALIVGGSRGIGRAIVERFARDGAEVCFSYVSNEKAAEEVEHAVTTATVGSAFAVRADLAVVKDIDMLFEEAERRLGSLDIVVSNAGNAIIKPVVELTIEEFDRVMSVNARGTFAVMRQAAQRVSDGGRIIVTSTGGTRMLMTETAAYLASKGAVEQVVRVMSQELGGRHVTVNAVSPGYTDTDLLPERDRAVAADASPFGRIGAPAEIASAFAFLARDDAGWITGQNLGVGGGVM